MLVLLVANRGGEVGKCSEPICCTDTKQKPAVPPKTYYNMSYLKRIRPFLEPKKTVYKKYVFLEKRNLCM